MSDPKDVETPQIPDAKPHVAKPGVIDKGDTVTGSGGELFSGHISDIADGDD